MLAGSDIQQLGPGKSTIVVRWCGADQRLDESTEVWLEAGDRDENPAGGEKPGGFGREFLTD